MVQSLNMKILGIMNLGILILEEEAIKLQLYQKMQKLFMNMLYLIKKVSIGMQLMKVEKFTVLEIVTMEKYIGMGLHDKEEELLFPKKFNQDLIIQMHIEKPLKRYSVNKTDYDFWR